jgi:mono/diheme cytochrome c family protein
MRAAGLAIVVLGGAAAVVLAGAAAFVRLGVYDVAATTPHTQPVYTLLENALRWAVRRRARAIVVPARNASDEARGAACFQAHCLQCHGGPGIAPAAIGLSMQPLPGPLVAAATDWSAAELYWITRHGIKLSGMPAWQQRMDDGQLGAVVFFVQGLGRYTPAGFAQALAAAEGQGCERQRDAAAVNPAAANAARGPALLHAYGCGGCHTIPGVGGSDRQVGPPLAAFGRRTRLPGGRPNAQENLAQWLLAPQALAPGTAMPTLGLTVEEAHDIAAYLNGLR